MNCTRFLVRPTVQHGWMIDNGGREMGPYYSSDLALRVAVSEALCCRRSGQSARVVVENDEGTVVADRCLCPSGGHCSSFDR